MRCDREQVVCISHYKEQWSGAMHSCQNKLTKLSKSVLPTLKDLISHSNNWFILHDPFGSEHWIGLKRRTARKWINGKY